MEDGRHLIPISKRGDWPKSLEKMEERIARSRS